MNKRASKTNVKKLPECSGEFFEGLDFLVTFLAMKKVTKFNPYISPYAKT